MHMHMWHHSEMYQPEKAFSSDRGNHNPRVQLQFKYGWRGVSAPSPGWFQCCSYYWPKNAHLLKQGLKRSLAHITSAEASNLITMWKHTLWCDPHIQVPREGNLYKYRDWVIPTAVSLYCTLTYFFFSPKRIALAALSTNDYFARTRTFVAY